jgi:hypothetical protein
MPGQIHEVYTELGQILNDPEAFGLGKMIPAALAGRLQSSRRMLEQALREQAVSSDHCRCRTTPRGSSPHMSSVEDRILDYYDWASVSIRARPVIK